MQYKWIHNSGSLGGGLDWLAHQIADLESQGWEFVSWQFSGNYVVAFLQRAS